MIESRKAPKGNVKENVKVNRKKKEREERNEEWTTYRKDRRV